MSCIMMHIWPSDIHPLSLSPGPMGDISVHASVVAHDTTVDNSNHRGARYVPRNIISIATRDTTLEMVHPFIIKLLSQPCFKCSLNYILKQQWGDSHFDIKAQFATRNTTPTNKQQVSRSFSTSHKEIHEFSTLNKGLEIHLPQFIEQSLRDFSFPFLLNF